MNTYVKTCAAVVVGALVLAAPLAVQARTVTFPFQFEGKTENGIGELTGDGPGGDNRYDVTITGSFEKEVQLESNGSYLGNDSSVSLGQQMNLNVRPTTGNWVMQGAQWDTPPMDGKRYTLRVDNWKPRDRSFGFTVPSDQGVVTLSSSNPTVISCSGLTCQSNSQGNATITVTFENSYASNIATVTPWNSFAVGLGTSQQVTNQFNKSLTPNGYGLGSGTQTANGFGYIESIGMGARMGSGSVINDQSFYKFDPITYNITVASNGSTQDPGSNPDDGGTGTATQNQPQTVTYNGTTEVTTSAATLNWTYSDPENDPQTQYQVQVARDAGFTDIVANFSQSGEADRTFRVSGLADNSVYYPRVRSANQPNGWSGWSPGDGFTTAETIEANSSASIDFKRISSFTNSGETEILTEVPRVPAGEDYYLEWAAVGADNCNGTGGSGAGFNGNQPVGDVSARSYTGTIPGEYTLRIECTASDSASASGSTSSARAQAIANATIQGADRGYTFGGTSTSGSASASAGVGCTGGWFGGLFGGSFSGSCNSNAASSSTVTATSRTKIIIEDATDPLPTPELTVTINGQGSDEDISVVENDDVELEWVTTNPIAIDRCRATTFNSNGDTVDLFTGLKDKNGGTETQKAPEVEGTETYTVQFVCDPVPGGEAITPINIEFDVNDGLGLSCSVNTPTVDDSTDAEYTTTVSGGVAPYSYTATVLGQPASVTEPTSLTGISDVTTDWKVSFDALSVGQQITEFAVTDSSGQQDTVACGAVTNFGNRNIEEVNP